MPKFTFAARRSYGDGTVSRLEYPVTWEGDDMEDAKSKLPPHHIDPRPIGMVDDPSNERDFLGDPARLM